MVSTAAMWQTAWQALPNAQGKDAVKKGVGF
jgi:hypothetical protein